MASLNGFSLVDDGKIKHNDPVEQEKRIKYNNFILGYSSKISEQGAGGKGAIRTNHLGKALSRSKRASSNAICEGLSLTPV